MVSAWDASTQRDCTGDLVGAQQFSNKFARGTGVTLSSLNRSPLRQRDHYIKNQEKNKFKHTEFDQPWRDADWRPDVHKDKTLPQDKDKSFSFSCTLESGKREFKHKNKQPHPWAIEHTYTHVPESMQLGRAREGPRGIQNPMVRLQIAMGVFDVQRDPEENDKLNENVNEQVRLRKLNKHLAQLQEGMQSPPSDHQQASPGLEAASSPALGFFKGSKKHAPDPFPSALEAGTGAWFSSEKDGKWFSAEAREPAAGDDGPWFNKNGVWGKEDKLFSSEKANEARPSPAELRNQSPADLIRQTNSPGGFFRGASSAAGASPAH